VDVPTEGILEVSSGREKWWRAASRRKQRGRKQRGRESFLDSSGQLRLPTPFKRDLTGCGKTVVAREPGGTGEADGCSRSEVRGFQNVEPRTSNFASRMSRVSRFDRLTVLSQVEGRAIVGGAEVGDDESRVGDWVCREGGCVLIGYRGAQSLGRLTDGKRERRVLLNLLEMGHCIPAPSWNRELRQPRVGGEGHGASGTDSRLPVVAVLPRGLGCREFPFNQRCQCHQARSFQ